MHYRNGREAKNGDHVVMLPTHGAPVSGILYDAVAGNSTCNGRVAITCPNDPYPNLAECLHADDVAAALARPAPGLGDVPDVSCGKPGVVHPRKGA